MVYSWQKAPRLHFLAGTHIKKAAEIALLVFRTTLANKVLFRFNGIEFSVPKDGLTPEDVEASYDKRVLKR